MKTRLDDKKSSIWFQCMSMSMESLFNSGMSSIKHVPHLKIRLVPLSTKLPSNSKANIAFSISIGSAFVSLCLSFIHFLSKHLLSIIFRPQYYYCHILRKCDIGGFWDYTHTPHFFFYRICIANVKNHEISPD